MKRPVLDTAPKVIKRIDFGILSSQDVKQLSVLELHQRDLYDVTRQNRPPARFGALDRRLGTADKAEPCETCGENVQDCVGHFGVIRLVLPVFHIGYFKLMITVLQNICKTCSKVMVDEQTRRLYLKRLRNPNLDGVRRKEILKNLNALCKKTARCPHCSSLNGMVKKVGALKIVHEKFKKKAKTEEEEVFRQSFEQAIKLDPALKSHISKAQEDLNPLTVIELFSAVSDEDCELMGLNPEHSRPELFIWNALPVPPVCIRPSVGQESSSTEDDITVLASEIVDINTKIRACMQDGTQTPLLMEYWDFLQLQCAMYVTSDLPGIPTHLQGNLPKIKKGFCQRLKGKHGRFRGNLSGKRVDFSGRTVISPDPNLRIDQVAVPERVCKILTYPERVTPYNIERLRKNIINGPDVLPGATYVTAQSNGMKRFLKYGNRRKIADELRVGDTVDRHLQDDDVVLFNRQPSLHKLSIMSHFVKVRPWRTFRFNECVCTPYNADFDGDEMNLHVPQTEEARAEAIELMGVKNNLVTPRNGEPLIAATQDFITASYLLSRKDVFYDRSQFAQICSYLGDSLLDIELPPPTIWKPFALWTGKQIFGVLLRPNKSSKIVVNLETKCRTFDKDQKDRNGTPFSKLRTLADQPFHSSMCPNDGYLFIHNSELMSGVIDKAIIGDGNKKSMFYVVLRDYGPVAAAECMNKIAKLSARWLANQGFSIGINDVQPGDRLRKEKEITVERGYSECDKTITLSREGKLPNQPGCNEEQTLESKLSGILSKIRDDVGQVCFQELNKYNAPLIMSLCGSKGMYMTRSSKINVSQMVACVGQQIISGNRIPNGFGDRSLPHFPKNSKTPPAKGFVRNSFYSGLSPTEFLFHAVSGREGLVDTAVKTAETGYMQRRLMKALEDLVCHYDLSVRDSSGGIIQFKYGDDGLDPPNIEGSEQPVEFTRNLMHSQAVRPTGSDPFLTKQQAMSIVASEIKKKDFRHVSGEFIKSLQSFLEAELTPPSPPPSAARDIAAHPIKSGITAAQLHHFLSTCKTKYARAVIQPGTAVGAVGGQSIGEPGTQMTLKTFHFAGVASMNVTLGVPRIKEIINASKNISTPIIDTRLIQAVGGYGAVQTRFAAEAASRVVKARIEKTLLEDVMEYIQEIITGEEVSLKIKIDLETIRKLQLEVNIHSIRDAIVRAPKLKISDVHIKVETADRLRVVVPRAKNDTVNPYILMQALKRALPKVVIKGLPTVARAVINDVEAEKRLNLLVEGYGLREVMGVDGKQTIIDEILYTMKSHGMTIDRRHVMLLADLMTFKGEVLGITRFGIAKMKDSVLMLASFEKTTDHLFEASFFSKHDKIQGVSECIIMGVPMTLGTGLFKLVQQTDQQPKKQMPLLFDSPDFHVPLK
ncbi:DNA-directed RNA polymerase III subunit C1 (rpo31) [Polyrhizophydium stewartii]|uniref:DNA-directed RNA polymerase subunit n=1 Tax=Polyrhizophydium stewartii TaxID=2732419 RepID=A0ABR4MVL4_9FUNG